MVETARPDGNVISNLRFACWIIKATDTLITFNTYYFCTATIVTRTRLDVTLYRGADKSLARPTSRCILFDGENI